jgi:hypothetical protein
MVRLFGAWMVVAAAVTVLVPRPALAADVSEADKAAAQELFDEGRRLVEKGQYAEACPKFARSEELDPGGGTLLNLAACHEKLGRSATAWAEFNDALSSAIRDGRADRQRYARKHIEALRGRLAQVVVSVVQPTPGQQVRIDDVPLAQGAWGLPTPIDPGTHIIDSTAPDRQAFRKTVTVAEGNQIAVEIEPLGAAGPAEAVAPLHAEGNESSRPSEPAAAQGRAAKPTPAQVLTSPSGDSVASPPSTRTLGFVVGGAGVAALGVGTYFGLRAISSWSDSNKGCPANVCTPQGASDAKNAKNAAVVSDVAFVGGLLAVGAGVVLVLSSGSARPHDRRALQPALRALRFSLASVAIDGTW